MTSLLMSVAIAALWARGFWHPMEAPFTRRGEACRVTIEHGALGVDNEPQYLHDLANQHRDQMVTQHLDGLDLMTMPPWHVTPRWGWSSVVLLPIFIVGCGVIGIVPTVFVTVTRRSRRGKLICRQCGYDLTGNASGVCPECGKDVQANSKTANG